MKHAFALLLAALVTATDLVTKTLVFAALSPEEMRWLLGDRDLGIGLTESLNRGVTGGLFAWIPPAVISVLTGAAVVAIAVWLLRSEKGGRLSRIALALVLGGALGNLVDRIWFGHVRDFIDVYPGIRGIRWLEHWPTFNVADAAIVVGVCLLVFQSLFLSKEEPSPAKE